LKIENGELIMKISKIFLVLILMFNFGFGQSSLNKQLKKIITETEKRANAKITENDIDNKLWTENIKSLKKMTPFLFILHRIFHFVKVNYSSFIQRIFLQSIMEMNVMNLLVFRLQKLNTIIKLKKIC